MARIRTVKPELYRHRELFELELESGFPIRTAFTGLFTVCDREGRFKWRPWELKLDVLPYDNLDFERVLDALESRGFVVRYEIQGEEYGCIPSFAKHQIINNKERASEIPEPPKNQGDGTREPRVGVASSTPLNPDSGEKEGKGTGKEGEHGGADASAPPRVEYEKIRILYNEILGDVLQECRILSDDRKRSLKARVNEDPKRYDPDWWRRYFEIVRATPFLIGRGPPNPQTGKPWPGANFEWLLKQSKMVKILEGQYEREH